MANSIPGMDCRQRRSARLRLCSIIIFGAMLTVAPIPVVAETQVQGSPAAVRIEAQDSSIENIFTALGAAFDLRYRSSINLDNKLTGTYRGSLHRVIARVLEGYDFILTTNKGRVEVTVLGMHNATPVSAATIANPTAAKVVPVTSQAPTATSTPSKIAPKPTLPLSPPAAVTNIKTVDEGRSRSLVSMLNSAAIAQIKNSNIPVPVSVSGMGGLPTQAEIAALARTAGADVDALRVALDRLPR